MHHRYSIADTIEVLLLEQQRIMQAGPHFRIDHRYRRVGINWLCAPGEEIAAIQLLSRGQAILLALPLSLRLLFEYLAKSRHLPQSATQIAAGIRASSFYRKHGMNSGIVSTRKISRSAIKVYIQRLRKSLVVSFKEAGLPLRPDRVLVSHRTVGNEIVYQLRATISWSHTRDST